MRYVVGHLDTREHPSLLLLARAAYRDRNYFLPCNDPDLQDRTPLIPSAEKSAKYDPHEGTFGNCTNGRVRTYSQSDMVRVLYIDLTIVRRHISPK